MIGSTVKLLHIIIQKNLLALKRNTITIKTESIPRFSYLAQLSNDLAQRIFNSKSLVDSEIPFTTQGTNQRVCEAFKVRNTRK